MEKFRRGVFIPNPEKKERGNPNKYVAVPQEEEPQEYDTRKVFCGHCKETRIFKMMFIKDPLQPLDVGMQGVKVKPFWIHVCKICGFPDGGVSIIDGGEI